MEPKQFEIVIEFYSYELFNTSNNVIQSARKLAKQFSEFASFKKSQSSNSAVNQMSHLFNNALTHSTNNYSCSINKFKLIARASLTQNDISEHVETKNLTLISDSSKFCLVFKSYFSGSLIIEFKKVYSPVFFQSFGQ